MPLEKAKDTGAIAFGEKYDQDVRVLTMGEFSKELSAAEPMQGPLAKLVSLITTETSIAAGIRRIEAHTGLQVIHKLRSKQQKLDQIGELLKAAPNKLLDKIETANKRLKNLEAELPKLIALQRWYHWSDINCKQD